MGALSYFKEFFRIEWFKKFIAAKTEPLQVPAYFRNFPELTGNECTHCLECKMICPAPGAIDVFQHEDGQWRPQIIRGHCFRCGYCVEICPEEVLTSGGILAKRHEQNLAFTHEYKVLMNSMLCMGCGNCCTACPVNREIEPNMGSGGTSVSTNVLMRVEKGKNTVLHNDLCKGCKICEDTCPNGAVHVIRHVEAIQTGEY
ncbi:MAG: 4Fe-4S dicluster domain-containing protein [Methanocalculaceae archaeon]|jgi:energy-converting hydrogenase A subunit P|nr:4Fe-4S dicluster domain-containing protein [Methanocalculaceae archaeon]